MFLKILETFICIFSIDVLAFVELGYGQEASDMKELGRSQYQLIEERSRLPRYGDCWRQALEHIHEGCRELSENTQSDMALHITNCFLAMSGHETYKCELDKKQNLRGICINSMSDRAFNAYTEFYTHTQNICWFLRGQMWHEKITETTMQVGEKLEKSVEQQERLVREQQRSLELQERLLQYGVSLERALNQSREQATLAVTSMRDTIVRQQQLLAGVSDSVDALRSWLLGEISWIDSLVFYVVAAVLATVLTSSVRSATARLPLLLMLSVNFCMERYVCGLLSTDMSRDARQTRDEMYWWSWWCRRVTVLACVTALAAVVCSYRDLTLANNLLLTEIHKQNGEIRQTLEQSASRANTPDCQFTSHTPIKKYNLRSRLATPLKCANKSQDPIHSRV